MLGLLPVVVTCLKPLFCFLDMLLAGHVVLVTSFIGYAAIDCSRYQLHWCFVNLADCSRCQLYMLFCIVVA